MTLRLFPTESIPASAVKMLESQYICEVKYFVVVFHFSNFYVHVQEGVLIFHTIQVRIVQIDF